MPTTPNWKAANNGIPGNLDATNHAAQLSQFLGTHNIRGIYTGSPLVAPTNFLTSPVDPDLDSQSMTWLTPGNNTDFSQPFTMPAAKTSIQRVMLPVQIVGNGADMMVTLHPDSGGSPVINTVLSGSFVSASEISALSAVNGLSSLGPVADPKFATVYATAPRTVYPWAYPAGGTTAIGGASHGASGTYILIAGGNDVSGAPTAQVFSQQYIGGGVLNLPLLQPALPQPTSDGAMAILDNVVVYTTGVSNPSGTTKVTNTWVASWDANTGVVGSWSAQAAFPEQVVGGWAVGSGNNVYVLGGSDVSGNPRSKVYSATVNNGQLAQWTVTNALPIPLSNLQAAVCGNWIIVTGGLTTGGSPSSKTFYARINSDGSLGAWANGPDNPYAGANESGSNICSLDNLVLTLGSSFSTSLTVTDNGIANAWVTNFFDGKINGVGLSDSSCLVYQNGDGSYDVIYVVFDDPTVFPSSYVYRKFDTVPLVPVPLPASGLSAGSKYHVVIRQVRGSTDADYLQFGINKNMLSSDTLSSPRYSSSAWSTVQVGFSMPMWVYESLSSDTSQLMHTWEDPTSTGSTANSNLASATKTFTYTRYQMPLGILESTNRPNDALNLNPTFTTGVANWTPTNCTFVQSSAQVHGGFAFSGLMTPNGAAAAPKVVSEKITVTPSLPTYGTLQWYMANGWFYSPTGWATVSLSIDWYDRNSTFISTSSTTQSLAAATWTNIVNYYQPPAAAAYGSLNFTESGTPAAGNTVYFSNVTLTLTNELTPNLPAVSQLSYNNGSWPATSVTQLA